MLSVCRNCIRHYNAASTACSFCIVCSQLHCCFSSFSSYYHVCIDTADAFFAVKSVWQRFTFENDGPQHRMWVEYPSLPPSPPLPGCRGSDLKKKNWTFPDDSGPFFSFFFRPRSRGVLLASIKKFRKFCSTGFQIRCPICWRPRARVWGIF